MQKLIQILAGRTLRVSLKRREQRPDFSFIEISSAVFSVVFQLTKACKFKSKHQRNLLLGKFQVLRDGYPSSFTMFDLDDGVRYNENNFKQTKENKKFALQNAVLSLTEVLATCRCRTAIFLIQPIAKLLRGVLISCRRLTFLRSRHDLSSAATT